MGLRTGGRRAKSLKNRVKSSKIELRFREVRSKSRSSCSTVLKKISFLSNKSHNHADCGIYFLSFTAILPQIIVVSNNTLFRTRVICIILTFISQFIIYCTTDYNIKNFTIIKLTDYIFKFCEYSKESKT